MFYTWSFVLDATTKPFLKMECQFSMCDPLEQITLHYI